MVTLCGGLFIICCGLLYGYCWWRGETGAYTPAPGRDQPEDRRSLLTEEGGDEEDAEGQPYTLSKPSASFKLQRDDAN